MRLGFRKSLDPQVLFVGFRLSKMRRQIPTRELLGDDSWISQFLSGDGPILEMG